MANNSKNNVTAADVVAEASKDRLIAEAVPAQGEKKTVTEEVKVTVEETTEDPKLTIIEGGKKSLKERAKALAEKVEKNKKAFIAVGIAAAAATVAVAKVVAKRSLEKELAQAENENSDEVEQYEEIKDTAVASDATAA
jgi:cob(I)alamin adenosyltransferase